MLREYYQHGKHHNFYTYAQASYENYYIFGRLIRKENFKDEVEKYKNAVRIIESFRLKKIMYPDYPKMKAWLNNTYDKLFGEN